MRRLISALGALLLCLSLQAVPAQPGKLRYVQPDGSIIVLQMHGDEYFNWITDQNGTVVAKGDDGFYRPVEEESFKANRRKAASIRPSAWSSFDNPIPISSGDRKVLAILVEFTDIKFILDDPLTKFSNLLNQPGYSYDGSIGSVRDYFLDNSMEQYRPSFDVFGPVTVSHNEAYYAGQKGTQNVSACVMEALGLLQNQFNAADYDTDGDGAIDMVIMYFAGHNQAEWAGEYTIWPHQSTSYIGNVGGKKVNRYFCTSECRGQDGSNICGIGTTCHEFSHALGLPDFYDTDYEENGKNEFQGGNFDLMTSGNYNDNGRRPPYLNALERNMLGWMPLGELGAGNHVLPSIRTNLAYYSQSRVDGEYFVLECRDNYKWDSAVPDYGMVIYQVDKSSRTIPGTSIKAAQLWLTNKINAYGGHPCFRMVPAKADAYCALPGADNIRIYSFTDWDGNPSDALLKDISFDGSQVSFSLSLTNERQLFGNVRNTTGQPIAGARVVLTQSQYKFAPARIPLDRDVVAITGEDGAFLFTLPETASESQILTVYASGYIPESINITANTSIKNQQFYLSREGEGEHTGVERDHSGKTLYLSGFQKESVAVSVRYSAKELADMGLQGGRIESVTFMAQPSKWEKAWLVIDTDKGMGLRQDISSSFTSGAWNTVTVEEPGFVIPDSGYIYVGYGFTGMDTSDHPFGLYGTYDSNMYGTYRNTSFQNSSNWTEVSWSNNNYFCFIASFEASIPTAPALNNWGYAFIKLANGTPMAVPPSDKTLYSEAWTVDGAAVAQAPVLSTLSSGPHTLSVTLSYYDGTSETVYYDYIK